MSAKDAVDRYLETVPSEFEPLVRRLRGLVFEVHPDASEAIKWNKLTYAINGTNQFYIDHYSNHVTLGFKHGADLNDPQGVLEGTGKQMRHIKFREDAEIAEPTVRKLLKQVT